MGAGANCNGVASGGLGSLSGVWIGFSIGPFVQGGLDEAFGLSVGPWCVRFGADAHDLPRGRREAGPGALGARGQPVHALVRVSGPDARARDAGAGRITDQRLWRIVEHYVGQAVARLDLARVSALGLDETASKRGHNYVTVFIDLDRTQKPVVFVTPGKGKRCLARFYDFLVSHGGEADGIVEVVCDMSPAFLAAIGETFEQANVTVDWFHVVQLFTKAVDEVRNGEAKHNTMPRTLRWAVLKAADGKLRTKQAAALAELEAAGLFTVTA